MQVWKLTLGLGVHARMSSNYLYVDSEAINTIYCIAEGINLPLSCKLISNHVSLM
jgi:hypothetical protein